MLIGDLRADALHIHDGITFGWMVSHNGIELTGDNEGGLRTGVQRYQTFSKNGLRQIFRPVSGFGYVRRG